MKHIEFEALIQYLEGSFSAADSREISAHLKICPSCSDESKRLEDFFGYASSSQFESVPQAVTANLLNIYKPLRTAPKKVFSVRKLLANLVFDDWQTALNERFVLSDSRQMLYRAGHFDIDLRFNFAGEKCQVSGQVFPDCQNGSAEILSDSAREKVSLNQDCEFVFPPLKNGIYDLLIDIDGIVVEIRKISLLV